MKKIILLGSTVTLKHLTVPILLFIFSNLYSQSTVENFAYLGGYVEGICQDSDGNFYVTDKTNHQIKKITSTGVVSVFAGSGSSGNIDGTRENSSFNMPSGVCVDESKNVYVADFGNNRIRKIDKDGNVSTLAGSGNVGSNDGTGLSASFSSPWGICLAPNGDLFVSDQWNFKIRRITKSGVVSTFCNVGLAQGWGICADDNNNIYIALRNQKVIEKYNSDGSYAGTFCGSYNNSGNVSGDSINTRLSDPVGLCYYQGNIYFTDNPRIKKVDMTRFTTHIAGNGGIACSEGPALTSPFWGPNGICIGLDGSLYETEYFCSGVHRINNLTSGIKELPDNKDYISIFPNPINNQLTISVKNSKEKIDVSIVNNLGEVLKIETISVQNETIDLINLKPGIYFLRIGDSTSEMIKFVKL